VPPGRSWPRRRPAPSRAEEGDQHAAECVAADLRGVPAGPVDGIGLAQLVSGDGLRQQAGGGGEVEAETGAAHRGEHQQLPDPGGPGQHQDGGQGLGGALRQLGRDDDPVAGQPVGHDPAEQQEGDHRQQRGGRHIAHVGACSADGQYRERDGDHGDARARDGNHVAGEQQPEIAAAQRARG
jgi:hypothetical protein